ncbi:hypothetical protein SAMN05444008_105217 [Cnuella takakiae]|uniref:DUF3945 domain-containing protein n=2 Tax=Cnuella takakiae TaxID=1302690 RepID=A0A1M4ZGW9_9BACT|nr:hypothetical protein [Cnuella takakiae]SHF17198.1 hypothetical protein SAMN05444008_105217 [Cnuella takakiae]
MNEKNFSYLKDTLKYLGFGEGLHASLEEKLKERAKEFQLGYSATFGDRRIDASLSFRKSDTSDIYFFNKWNGTVGEYEAARSQNFYINKGHGITLKEGFNLLEGRAVHKELTDKEGQTYKAWLQLDSKEKDATGNYKVNQYHEKYGFDLQQKLEALPIKQLADPELKEGLIRSLQKGNMQTVTFEKNRQSDQLLVAANPRFKSIAVFDQSGKQIPQHSLDKRYDLEVKKPELTLVGKAAEKEAPQKKQELGEVRKMDGATSKKEEKAKTQSGSADGLEKKRTGKQKGMHP